MKPETENLSDVVAADYVRRNLSLKPQTQVSALFSCRPLFAAAMAIALILGGCVTIPLPPMDGEKVQAGDWGSVKIMITYVPNITNLYNSYKEWKKPEQ